MIIEINSDFAEIDLQPAETAEIIQNVRMILSTAQKSVPLFREFGIAVENLDAPINIAQAKLTAEIAQEIAKYEPRAALRSCKLTGNAAGTLKITAQIEIR